ncbi:hypothetical protein BpHYR1_027429 [Brachionus plicatilis]|uniref:Uncharacterized protein n=1 Tax=Brachionus plicatilis TaxID=10195 RepID=A0A3M7RWG1_BRAPC|nr:hypothetical protein BpHYR1_027429 [Brachionus plicatilis]
MSKKLTQNNPTTITILWVRFEFWQDCLDCLGDIAMFACAKTAKLYSLSNKRNISNVQINPLWVRLNLSMVRPNLDYAVQIGLVKNLVNRSEKKGPSGALEAISSESREKKRFCGCSNAKHVFFTNRVVPHWNKLRENVVKFKSTVSLKTALDKFHGIGYYGSKHGQSVVMGSDTLHTCFYSQASKYCLIFDSICPCH